MFIETMQSRRITLLYIAFRLVRSGYLDLYQFISFFYYINLCFTSFFIQ